MGNFIEELDERYRRERKKNKIKKENKSFVCNIPFRVSLHGKVNENYIIRKGKLTRFLYIKDDCRVYFTDADILTMLLQIQNNITMDLLIENLIRVYKKSFEQYNIWISKKKYEVVGMAQIKDEQILTNPYDIDISFNELFVLINLILSKDQASIPLWPSRPDFLKHTTSKYISLIKYYYYGDEKARSYLLDMGYDVEKSIYSNYDTLDKRDEKRKFFCNFNEFEKNGLL